MVLKSDLVKRNRVSSQKVSSSSVFGTSITGDVFLTEWRSWARQISCLHPQQCDRQYLDNIVAGFHSSSLYMFLETRRTRMMATLA